MRAGAPSLAVIGGGAWGTALASVAAAVGENVLLWMRDAQTAREIAATRINARYLPGISLPQTVRPVSDLNALAEAGAALLVTPAQTMRAMARSLRHILPKDAPLVICAKGIERETGRFLSDVVKEERPGSPVAVLSGPSFAKDVARGLPTAVTLACHDAALAEQLANRLSRRAFRVYHTRDVRGVEIGGAGKNVLAIACGAVIGRGLGESAKAALMARGFAELMRFALAHGVRTETLMGLSGLGDVVLTCSSAQSRNFAFGERLGRGASLTEASGGKLVEGALTASVLVRLARERGVDMPIAAAVDAILAGRATLDQAIDGLMSRPIKSEYEEGA